MTAQDLTPDNVEKISTSNVKDAYDFDCGTEKYFRTGIEVTPEVYRLKNTGETFQFDYKYKKAYDEHLNELDNAIGERLVELKLAHPGGIESDDDLADLIAATDYRADGSPENVEIEREYDDDDSEDEQ